jgi:TM2 domain-containing membrane protein YozV
MRFARVRNGIREGTMKNPGTAAVLSFLIPGVGQIYNGKFLRAIFWLIITPGLWIGTGGTLGWVCHIISAYTAYAYAKSQLESSPQSID